MKKVITRINKMRKNAASVYLPALLVQDSAFPLECGKVLVEINDKTLVISQCSQTSSEKG